MRNVLIIVLFLLGKMAFCQDSVQIPGLSYSNRDIQRCMESGTPIQCFEETIQWYQNALKDSTNNQLRTYKTLIVCHLSEGWIYYLRRDLEKSARQIDQAAVFVDSMALRFPKDQEGFQMLAYFKFVQQQICTDYYKNDTIAFECWNCSSLFPELNPEKSVEPPVVDTVRLDMASISIFEVEKNELFGEFYNGNVLRFNPDFSSDSASIIYFNGIKDVFLQNLIATGVPDLIREIRTDSLPDTLIVQINLRREPTKISKDLTLVYSSTDANWIYYLLHDLINFDIPHFNGNCSFYVPIIIQMIESKNGTPIQRIFLDDDHFFMGYQRPRPVKLD